MRRAPAAAAIAVAAMAALGACTVSGAPATSSPEATRSADAGTTTPSLEPTSPVEAGATTLRTIAEATEAGSQLTVVSLLSANDAYTSHAATYTSAGLMISAVLHEPLAPGPHPGVVLVHGFVAEPDSYVSGGDLEREQDALARAGYVVLYTDLRGLAGSDPAPSSASDLDLDSTEDVINAIRALASSRLPGLDPTRIGLFGHSLGGLLALDVLVAKPALVNAVAVFAPSSTDRFKNVERYLPPGTPLYQAVIAAHGTPTTNPQYWADVSPRTFLDHVTAPLLIVHGDADVDVPYEWSVATVAALHSAGKDVAFVTLKGETHVFQTRWNEAMSAVTAFLAEHLE